MRQNHWRGCDSHFPVRHFQQLLPWRSFNCFQDFDADPRLITIVQAGFIPTRLKAITSTWCNPRGSWWDGIGNTPSKRDLNRIVIQSAPHQGKEHDYGCQSGPRIKMEREIAHSYY